MNAIYGFLLNLIFSFALLKFYSLIRDESIEKKKICIIPIMYAIYRMSTVGMIDEPFRMLMSLAFFSILLVIFEKKVSLIILLVAFLMAYILELIALLIYVITALIFGFDMEARLGIGTGFLRLAFPAIIYSSIVLLDKYKKITLSAYSIFLESTLVRRIVLTIGVLVVMLYSFLNISSRLGVDDFELSLVLLTVTVILALAIILLTIFIVRHLSFEREKQLRLEQENNRLALEHEAIQSQLSELENVYTSLREEFGVVTSNHHAYKHIVPVLMDMQQTFTSELDRFSEFSHTEKLTRIRDYADQIRMLSFQINNELAIDHIQSELEHLNISNDWQGLSALLRKLMQIALAKDVYLSIYNHIKSWEKLDIPQITFIRLLGNIADNAIKESCKIAPANRGEVKITLMEEEGYISFEVQDDADEFEISILKKLGERKNSTNGTGDGYAEIMQDLNDTEASFIIKEWKMSHMSGKIISVIFDGYNMKLIDSHYRFAVLQDELAGTELEIMDFY